MAELTVLNSEITKCLLKTHTKPKLSRSKAEQETVVIRPVVTIDTKRKTPSPKKLYFIKVFDRLGKENLSRNGLD